MGLASSSSRGFLKKVSAGPFCILQVRKNKTRRRYVFVLVRCQKRGTWKCQPWLIFWSLFRKREKMASEEQLCLEEVIVPSVCTKAGAI